MLHARHRRCADMPVRLDCPQEPLVSTQLAQEVALLGKLLYKNANQHRGAPYFRRLLEVRGRAGRAGRGAARRAHSGNGLLQASNNAAPQVWRLLGLLDELQLAPTVAGLHQALEAARQQQPMQPTATLLAQCG